MRCSGCAVLTESFDLVDFFLEFFLRFFLDHVLPIRLARFRILLLSPFRFLPTLHIRGIQTLLTHSRGERGRGSEQEDRWGRRERMRRTRSGVEWGSSGLGNDSAASA